MTSAVRVRLKSASQVAAIVALLGASGAFVYGIQTGIGWVIDPPRPDAPGEVCERDYDSYSGIPGGGECYPLPSWHMESWPNQQGRADHAYVHDDASEEQWRIDVGTSFMWPFLSREQQKEILVGKATIEKFRTAEEIDRVTNDQ